MTTFFSSDTHFCHPYVAALRGFASAASHDEEVIARWNAVVRPGDMAWLLGDVGLGHEGQVLVQAARLNGVIHLVTGNHDACWPGHRRARTRQRRWLEAFASVQAFATTRIDGHAVLLSHFPYLGRGDRTPHERYPGLRLPDQGQWLVHGHLHVPEQRTGPRQVHAGLDAWGLRPASEAQVAALIRSGREKAA